VKLWRSGIFYSALGFIGGLGNLYFQRVIYAQMSTPEYGYANSALTFIDLLSLPLTIISYSLVHYIAHFRANDDEARLQGLLAGYQKFLLRATVIGSILAMTIAAPLAWYFKFPRWTIMFAALGAVLVGLWSGYAAALCQGMAWFKRIAVIGFVAVLMRIAFGLVMTQKFSVAEVAVSATTFSLLANLALLYWHKAIFRTGQQTSPWDQDFVNFLIVAAGVIGGTYFFKADQLIAQKYFTGDDIGTYAAAGKLSQSLPMVVTPLLAVLFTSRSGHKTGHALTDQKILLALYGIGLVIGAIGLLSLRDIFVKLLVTTPGPRPRVEQMMIPYTIAMVFFGLSQAIGMWSLASRWFKLAIIYGVLGITYWVVLLVFGKTPDQLLAIMPYAAGISFVVLCVGWLLQSGGGKPKIA
jgi:O-antigen/teichoic acid export membrane protein